MSLRVSPSSRAFRPRGLSRRSLTVSIRVLLIASLVVFLVQLVLALSSLLRMPPDAAPAPRPLDLRIAISNEKVDTFLAPPVPPSLPPSTTTTLALSTSRTASSTTTNNPATTTTSKSTSVQSSKAKTAQDSAQHAETPGEYRVPPLSLVLQNPHLRLWFTSRMALCGGAFEGYASEFAVLHNVTLDPSRAKGKRVGGELLNTVMLQDAKMEYFDFEYGFFRMQEGRCKRSDTNYDQQSLRYVFNKKNHLKEYLQMLDPGVLHENKSASQHSTANAFTSTISKSQSKPKLWNRTAVVVTRNDYVNLFQTTADLYDMFLMMIFFQIHPDDMDIIFLDAHPAGGLDSLWYTLWPHVYRIGNRSVFSEGPVQFRRLIWLSQGYSSPMNTNVFKGIPLVEEFRKFILSRYNIAPDASPGAAPACEQLLTDSNSKPNSTQAAQSCVKKRYCKAPHILFLLRRDYVAHPRNPSGEVSRKLRNEKEVLAAVREALPPGGAVEVFIPTELSLREQIERVARADVLMGVHGAGHTLGLFLPPHGGIVEIFPSYYKMKTSHFKILAESRGLSHSAYINTDKKLDDAVKKIGSLPKEPVSRITREIISKLCKTFQTTASNQPLSRSRTS